MGPLEPIDKSGAIRNIFSHGKKCVKLNAIKARWKIMAIIIIIITYPSKEVGFQKLNHKYINSNYIIFFFLLLFFFLRNSFSKAGSMFLEISSIWAWDVS